MLISLVVYCLLGAIAGVLAGLLGVGGGIVIVPMLVFAFGWQNFPPDVLMLMALGTSMGSIMFTSISSSLAHSRNKGVQWDAVRNITPASSSARSAGRSWLPTFRRGSFSSFS